MMDACFLLIPCTITASTAFCRNISSSLGDNFLLDILSLLLIECHSIIFNPIVQYLRAGVVIKKIMDRIDKIYTDNPDYGYRFMYKSLLE